MKKSRFALLIALVFAVLTLSGCGDLWNAAKEVTKNKWTTVSVQSKAKDASESDSRTYDLKVYLYYTDTVKNEGQLSLKPGLNVVIEADAGNASFFGESISTASYAITTFGPGETIDNGKEGSAKKEFTVTDDKWAAAYAVGIVKPSDAPASKSGSYDSLSDKMDPQYWKEFMAEKIIDLLLG